MEIQRIPCCYIPSRVIAVDDNQEFIESFKLIIPKPLFCVIFDNPYEALDYLNTQYSIAPITKRWLKAPEDQEFEQVSVNINIREIHQEIYNSNRFNEISLIVTDYSMPGLDGINFCRNVIHKKIKKLLLTGEAGLDLAVQAFNEKLIDQFILKSDPEIAKMLNNAITALQRNYYIDLSNYVTETVTFTEQIIACLDDPKFISLFDQICKEYNIVEYYILDSQGSFLLLDQDACPVWLIVKDEEEMRGAQEMTESAGASEAIINALKHREQIPFFYSEADFDTPPEKWDKYMHPAKILEGKKRYYYAVVNNPDLYPLDSARIVSYQDFLKKQRQTGN